MAGTRIVVNAELGKPLGAAWDQYYGRCTNPRCVEALGHPLPQGRIHAMRILDPSEPNSGAGEYGTGYAHFPDWEGAIEWIRLGP